MGLLRFIYRRTLSSIPVLLGALVIVFFLTKAIPGDPIALSLGVHYNEQVYQSLRHQYGFDQPVFIQFLVYIKNLFIGDWGTTIVIGRGMNVWDMIWDKFPRTIELAILSMLFATIVGIKSGVISSTHRNKGKDTFIRGSSLLGVAIPVFWLGLMLQLVFGYYFKWFPVQDYLTVDLKFGLQQYTGFLLIDSLIQGRYSVFWNHLWHLVLPVLTLGIISLASITRQTRSSMLEVLEQDYIRTARAKGCSEKSVINDHALSNALIPTTTIIGLNVAGLLGGAVLTETVFNFNGLGALMIEAIAHKEYFLINAIVFLMTLIFVIVNLITDIIYAVLDPRIRLD